jgi:hypothetical protein
MKLVVTLLVSDNTVTDKNYLMVATHSLTIYQACDQAYTMIVVVAGVHSSRCDILKCAISAPTF